LRTRGNGGRFLDPGGARAFPLIEREIVCHDITFGRWTSSIGNCRDMHKDSLAATNRSDIAKSPSCIPSRDFSLVSHDVDDALSASLFLSQLTSNFTGTLDTHRVIQGKRLAAERNETTITTRSYFKSGTRDSAWLTSVGRLGLAEKARS
jgi:hypothetical protein